MNERYDRMNPWWENRSFDTGIKRGIFSELYTKSLKRRQIEMLAGGRRMGKTTLMKQLIAEYIKIYGPKTVFYINFEDPVLNRVLINEHVRNFRSKFGHRIDTKLYLFFDEVQECREWEAELKSLYDNENIKIFVTGSTSHMIAMRGGKLTGRQATTEVYPLDFNEYSEFKGETFSGAEGYLFEKKLDEYLQEGGYPEKVLHDPPDYIQNLMQDVITRDIIRYFRPRKDREVFELFSLLCAALGSRVSYSRFKKVLGITVDTIKDYIGYFGMAHMISVLEKWSYSANDRVYANKKVYLYDTGIKTIFDDKKDYGARAENALYLHLLKQKRRIGYFAENKREVDFVVDVPGGVLAVESKYVDSLEQDDVRLDGLKLFIKKEKPERVYIASRSVEKELKIAGTDVSVVPLWKILAGKENIYE